MASVDKVKCLEIIKKAISPPDTKLVWKNDPFEFLFKELKTICHYNHMESVLPEENEISDEVASTSTSAPVAKILDCDARLKYSKTLGNVYLELSKCLKVAKETTEDEYRLLSLQDINIISESFQFFVLTGVMPFLEQGVGVPASTRSSFVKTWKLYDGDVESQRRNLHFAANVILELFESNEAIKNQLIKKFIDDILAIKYQLFNVSIIHFDDRFAMILKETPRNLLISALMGLCKPKNGKATPPQWLQTKCGSELSQILIDQDGLFHFLSYYTDTGGENWTDNAPLRKFVAKHLATVPKIVKSSLSYHSNILKQFLELIDRQGFDEPGNRNLLLLFVAFIEEMNTSKNRHNADLVVFDHLLRFWEVLAERMTSEVFHSEKVDNFSNNNIFHIRLFAKMMTVGGYAGNERLLKIHQVLLNILDNEYSDISNCSKNILKTIFVNLKNPGELLYNFVIKPSRNLRIVERETSKSKLLIEEIGEKSKIEEDPATELWLDSMEEADIGVARRLELVCEILNSIFEEKTMTVILEILAKGVEDWMNLSKNENEEDKSMRFVDVENGESRSVVHAHLIVGVCFEKMANYISKDGFAENNEQQYILLLKIAENVLLKTSQTLESFHSRSSTVDIWKISDSESAELEALVEMSKMCIGLVSGVVFAASFHPEILENIERTLKITKEFVVSARKCESFVDNLKVVNDDAIKLLELMDLDVEIESKLPNKDYSRAKTKIKTTSSICEDLMVDLRNQNEEVAIRGGAIIQISKIFQKNNKTLAEELISMDIFEIFKGLISHSDSYIYLSVINCLGEMACYDRKFLQKLIDLYSNFQDVCYESGGNLPELDIVVRRGRIGEALGKVFRTIGEVSLLYLDQVAAVFVNSIREEDEIIRASCCCALGDIVLTCRGRGIEKWMDEMLYLLDSLILIDKSSLVRRAAVDLIRQCIKSCSTDVLQIMGVRLRDIRRKVVSLWKYDRDDVVRLHAQLCIEELKSAMDEIFEEETSRYCRRIKI